ncbi:hypothetical protein NIES4073_70240 [Kalymmatonema gypsitolerans NIES-4073]|nr:hypothetical protein NIES4073_70240 [Scytonema sp. NIES-4073]
MDSCVRCGASALRRVSRQQATGVGVPPVVRAASPSEIATAVQMDTDGIKEMQSCLLNSVKPILRALLRNNIDNPP